VKTLKSKKRYSLKRRGKTPNLESVIEYIGEGKRPYHQVWNKEVLMKVGFPGKANFFKNKGGLIRQGGMANAAQNDRTKKGEEDSNEFPQPPMFF